MPDVTQELNTALADRYVIQSELGEGGMATVYLAHDVKHNRKVALKVLKPELAAMIGAERFLNEIEVTANLQHPHILPLHDSGEASGFLYYVMPYVEGETLRTKLDREKQFSIDEAVQLTRAIAGALDYAHRQGVIHRDIKPENILLVDGQPEVADFGIALAVSQAGGTRLTETGLSIGTPQYMSPEQAMGDRELDARSDVYSVGAMLYEMLTGDPPYIGSTAQAIVAKVITEKAPPVTAARDTVPPHVAAAVDKALAKLPADRFGSAAQLAEALVTPGYLPTTVSSAAPAGSGPARDNRVALALAAVAIVAGVLAVWGWLRPAPEPPLVTRFSIALPADQQLQRIPIGYRFALSPDGRSMVYVGPGPAVSSLWLRRFDQLNATRLPGTEGGYNPSFSTDGRSILFHTEQPREVKLLTLSSGSVVTVADSALGTSGSAIGDDGYIYVDVDEGGMARLPRSGGDYQRVVSLDEGAREVGIAWPVYLPGGDGLIYRMRYVGTAPGDWNLVGLPLDGGEPKVITRGIRGQYIASDHLVYATGDGRLMAAPFDPGKLEITGPSQALIEGLTVGRFGVTEFSVADNGTLVYLVGGDSQVNSEYLVFDPAGGNRPAFGAWRAESPTFDLVPEQDGSRVALVLARGEENGSDVYVKESGELVPTRLTFDGEFNWSPRWSANGEWIYFLSVRDSTMPIYRKRADGSGRQELIDLPDLDRAGPFDLAESGGETWLVLTVEDEFGEADLVGIRPGQDTAYTPLLTGPQWQATPDISPDGRWLAFEAGDGNSTVDRVFVRPFPNVDGGQWQVSQDFGQEPRWAPDGRSIYYRDASGDLMVADVRTEPGFAVLGHRPALEDSQSFWAVGAVFAPLPNGEVLVVGSRGAGEESGELVVVQNLLGELE